MRRILLLNLPFDRPVQRDYGCPHSVKTAYYWPPIDLLLFGAAVRQEAELSYIDAIAGSLSRDSALAAIQEARPDAVFTILSSITLDSDLRFIAEVRRHLPDVRIWASGDVVLFRQERFEGIDYYVRDLTNREGILEQLRRDCEGGIIHELHVSEFTVGICPHELTLKYPYAMPYSLYQGIASVSTNYGCPFSCTFCNSNQLSFKRRGLDEVIEELLYIQQLGIREVVFRDFTFNMSDVDQLCDRIMKERIRLKWSCWTSASLVNMDILLKMKSSGCYLICYGAESGDEKILAEVRRPVGLGMLKEAVSKTKAAGIEALTSFIVGFPGEDLKKTEALLFELDPDYLSLNILAARTGSSLESEGGYTGRDMDSLSSPDSGLVKYRDLLERRFFIRPGKLLRYLFLSLKSPYRLKIFIRNGLGLIKRWVGRNPGR